MGKVSIITPEQTIFFDQVSKNDFIRSRFYFTGGTALSECYLQHRFSEDLDFFTEKPYETMIIGNFITALSKRLHFTFTSELIEGSLHRFQIMFPKKESLKVDFSYYEGNRVKKGIVYKNMPVDSLLDIAINKMRTVQQRESVKDFVDLYFLLQKFSIWDLIDGVKIKFNNKIEPWVLAADLINVENFQNMPRMIKPLTLLQLKQFFREEAKKLGLQVT